MTKEKFHSIHLISLGLVCVGLLFPKKISSITIILFGLLSALRPFIFKKKFPKWNIKVLVFLGFYFLYVFGYFYSKNTEVASSLLERNLSWLILPGFIYFFIDIDIKEKRKLLFFFAVATHVFAAFYLITAFFRYFKTDEVSVFYYRELTKIMDFHPIYFAMYLLFALAIFSRGYFKKYYKISFKIILLLTIFDALMLGFLSSKNVLAVFIISLCIIIWKYLKTKNKIIIVPVIIGLIVVSLFSFKGTTKRIHDEVFSKWELLSQDQFKYNDAFTGTTLRLITWKFVVKKMFSDNHYLTGVGSGDGQDFINDVYKEHNMDAAGYLNFNMHNQILEYFVKFGLLGVIYFLVLLIISFKAALKTKDTLYVFFLILFLTISITESNLEVQRGLIFFMVFNSLFLFYKPITSQA
jgi:hypothetical protein